MTECIERENSQAMERVWYQDEYQTGKRIY